MEKYGTAGRVTDDSIQRRMHILCSISKATDIHSEHVIFIACPPQQLLHESASLVRDTYFVCLVTHCQSFN